MTSWASFFGSFGTCMESYCMLRDDTTVHAYTVPYLEITRNFWSPIFSLRRENTIKSARIAERKRT